SVRLRIESLVLRRPALKPQEDHVLGSAKSRPVQIPGKPRDGRPWALSRSLSRAQQVRQRQPKGAESADAQPLAPADAVAREVGSIFHGEHGESSTATNPGRESRTLDI